MARKFNEIMRKRFSQEEIDVARDEARAELLEMSLDELRRAVGKTQVDAAAAARMTQGDVSKAEARADHRVSFLRRYVKALGGELEVCAVVEGKRIRLLGV